MEPVLLNLKRIQSPLCERRLMILILKKYSHGRRSFSESSRLCKIKDLTVSRQYASKEDPKETPHSPGYADSLTLST